MDDSLHEFEKRYRSIQARHRQMARGYVTKLGRNGVIQHQPRRQLPTLSLPVILMLGVGFIAFKSFLYVSLGESGYQARVDSLAEGTIVERGGSWLMQVDPATVWTATNIVPLLG